MHIRFEKQFEKDLRKIKDKKLFSPKSRFWLVQFILDTLKETFFRSEPIPESESKTMETTVAFQIIMDNAINLGVSDLAAQHDHYLYGVEKHEETNIY
ncbi:MAG: hypothetical protein B6242_04695 [Anaerolineaceae bacterium 4572_78]|nr:MAG: hypothetical protein B6242_04695 [Anaerolineaceae bacterium 4572_78]